MVDRTPEKHIHIEGHFSKIVLEQDVVLAVETKIDLRIPDPSHLGLLFLVQPPADINEHALPLDPLIVPGAFDRDVAGEGLLRCVAVIIQLSGKRRDEPLGIADRHIFHVCLCGELLEL